MNKKIFFYFNFTISNRKIKSNFAIKKAAVKKPLFKFFKGRA